MSCRLLRLSAFKRKVFCYCLVFHRFCFALQERKRGQTQVLNYLCQSISRLARLVWKVSMDFGRDFGWWQQQRRIVWTQMCSHKSTWKVGQQYDKRSNNLLRPYIHTYIYRERERRVEKRTNETSKMYALIKRADPPHLIRLQLWNLFEESK